MPLQIVNGDITAMKVDAIVNTTNEKMIGLSGVDYAVHKAAGPELDAECAVSAPLGLGCAKITKGYKLDAKYVIHTSGPVWKGGLEGESILLRSCYTESLRLAKEYGCETVAFPLISSGHYGYPKDQVLKFAVRVISEFLLDNEMTVYLCIYDKASYEFSKDLYDEISSFINGVNDGGRMSGGGCGRMPESFDGEKASLEEYVHSVDKSFGYKLFEMIDKSGMTDVECYKKANVDRKTFSKIKCRPDKYRPSKQTAVAFAIALRLSLDEAQELLGSAGMTLSRSFVFDKIIRYFIGSGKYDVFEINEALFEFGQKPLGVEE